MVKMLRTDSGVELPPFHQAQFHNNNAKVNEFENISLNDSSIGEVDMSLFNGSQDNSEDDDHSDNARDIWTRQQLESENFQLRAQLSLMRQQWHKFEQQHEQQPVAAALQRKSNRTKQRKHRRRWSLSSVSSTGKNTQTDPELGMFHQEQSDGSFVLFHDYLDHNASSRGLHHRKIGSGGIVNTVPFMSREKPFKKPLTKKRSDDVSTDDDDGDDDDDDDFEDGQETLRLTGDNPDPQEDHAAPFENSFSDDVKDRSGWLVGLMILQSLSSFIIKRNEGLLEDHIIIVQYLTMLVGAGGNAGNQASVRVIRGLATGLVTDRNAKDFLWRELSMGFVLAFILAISGCLRAILFAVPIPETLAITTSLLCIVFISISVGALLPIGMNQLGIDPAHSSTSIQVIMDILGVTITVHISKLFLTSANTWINGG